MRNIKYEVKLWWGNIEVTSLLEHLMEHHAPAHWRCRTVYYFQQPAILTSYWFSWRPTLRTISVAHCFSIWALWGVKVLLSQLLRKRKHFESNSTFWRPFWICVQIKTSLLSRKYLNTTLTPKCIVIFLFYMVAAMTLDFSKHSRLIFRQSAVASWISKYSCTNNNKMCGSIVYVDQYFTFNQNRGFWATFIMG